MLLPQFAYLSAQSSQPQADRGCHKCVSTQGLQRIRGGALRVFHSRKQTQRTRAARSASRRRVRARRRERVLLPRQSIDRSTAAASRMERACLALVVLCTPHQQLRSESCGGGGKAQATKLHCACAVQRSAAAASLTRQFPFAAAQNPSAIAFNPNTTLHPTLNLFDALFLVLQVAPCIQRVRDACSKTTRADLLLLLRKKPRPRACPILDAQGAAIHL